MTDPAQCATLVAAMGQTLQQQNTNILALQARVPTAQTPNRVVNPVLSTINTTVYMEEHTIPTGMEDVKGFPTPSAFTGHKTDAEPFMVRLKAYFAAKPKASKFTKNRILLALSLLKENPRSAAWAKLVERSIANNINDQYYYDGWDRFQAEFLKRFGLTNSKQHYFNRMTQTRQGKDDDCTTFCDAFERNRSEAGVSKDMAFMYLKQNTFPIIRTRLLMTNPPPNTYDDWVDALVRHQEQVDQEKEFRRNAFTFNPYRGQQSYQRQPALPKGHGDPMDVDAIKHKGKNIPGRRPFPSRSAPAKPAQSRPPQKTRGRLPPHPTAGQPRASSSNSSAPKKTYNCFLCDKPGHFARECTAKLNQLDFEHIQQMSFAMEDLCELQSQEGDNHEEDEEDPLEEDPLNEEYDQSSDLISFEELPTPSVNDEDILGQDF